MAVNIKRVKKWQNMYIVIDLGSYILKEQRLFIQEGDKAGGGNDLKKKKKKTCGSDVIARHGRISRSVAHLWQV